MGYGSGFLVLLILCAIALRVLYVVIRAGVAAGVRRGLADAAPRGRLETQPRPSPTTVTGDPHRDERASGSS